jgi:5-methylcytosine-specific restriction endonuclease McrA
MNEPISAEQLADYLIALRNERRQRQAHRRATTRRKSLKPRDRALILEKTGGRCHICGGLVHDGWEADHVLSHSGGGGHCAENYLPAHTLCNSYRWDYSSEESQWVLKIGVWARKQMESGLPFGAEMLRRFFEYEVRRRKRQQRGSSG